jgi:hypothetical protein
LSDGVIVGHQLRAAAEVDRPPRQALVATLPRACNKQHKKTNNEKNKINTS